MLDPNSLRTSFGISARRSRPAPARRFALPLLLPILPLLSLLAAGPAPAAEDVRPAPLPEGVTPQIAAAVGRGLTFLVRSQADDGSIAGNDRGYPVAMTALAGLALLSSGSTPTRGPCSPAIRKAEAYLLSASTDNGLFTASDAYEQRPMYGHAFTMTFLAQLLGGEESLERQAEIRDALRRAVDLTIRSQTSEGGWYYTPYDQDSEGTLTVTMMQGLRACRDAGIHVPKATIDKGVRYIERSANPDGGVRYKIRSSEVRTGTTCAAVVALWSAGRYQDPLLKRISDYIDRNIRPRWGGSSYRDHVTYGQYYLGQATFLLGSDRWKRFYASETRLLLPAQEDDGSWLTEEERRQHGVGAVYSTSVALIILQLPYNRLPIFQR